MPGPGRDPLSLDAWSRAHAVVVLAGVAGAAVLGRGWPLALVAAASFGVLLWHGAGRFTPRGGFGAANTVTLARLAIALLLSSLGREWPGMTIAATLASVWALDGLDGWIARSFRLASAFGATFDMETDALLVLIAVLLLWQRGRLGAWILIGGLLRYAYVLALALVPPVAGHVPRSHLARFALLALLAGLATAFVRADVVGTVAAALGTTAVVASFARSFRWSYRRR